MKKEFKRTPEGKVIQSMENASMMNPFEYMIYIDRFNIFVEWWEYFTSFAQIIQKTALGLTIGILGMLLFIAVIPFLPLIIVVRGIIGSKKCKQTIKE